MVAVDRWVPSVFVQRKVNGAASTKVDPEREPESKSLGVGRLLVSIPESSVTVTLKVTFCGSKITFTELGVIAGLLTTGALPSAPTISR